MNSQWSTLYQRAKKLEAQLEIKVQKYSAIAQKINADFLCDEENPLLEGREEQEVGADVEHTLTELADCIERMRELNANPATSTVQQANIIKRYHEIHFDYSTEFKNTSLAVYRKRESMELFQSSKKMHADQHDSSVEKLLKERSSVAASLKSINDVISQAFETRSTLNSQRSMMSGSASGLSGLSANVPSLGRLIDGIQKKKSREFMIISVLVALMLCFTIWWVFLR